MRKGDHGAAYGHSAFLGHRLLYLTNGTINRGDGGWNRREVTPGPNDRVHIGGAADREAVYLFVLLQEPSQITHQKIQSGLDFSDIHQLCDFPEWIITEGKASGPMYRGCIREKR